MPVLAYVATLNNYTPEDVAWLRTVNAKLNYLIVGHEVGENGTPHLQIYFQLANQAKLTTIKRWGGPWERMHFEAARAQSDLYEHELAGDFHAPYSARGYSMKDGNFFELGECRSMGKKGARSDLNAVKEAIAKGDTYDTICDEHFNVASRCSKFIKERVQARESGQQQDSLRELYASAVMRPWQQLLLDVVEEEACPRKIHWLWERAGNVGKSWMANYLGAMKGATILSSGKKVDLAYIYAQKPTKIVLFDLSRTNEASEERKHLLDGIYSLAEDLKNGRVVSTKYESKTVFFPPPHVIFFANFEPDMSKWSADRYFITELH